MSGKESKLKVPSGEWITTQYYVKGSCVPAFTLTKKIAGVGVQYTLYRVEEEKLVKLGKGASPLALEEKYGVNAVIRC